MNLTLKTIYFYLGILFFSIYLSYLFTLLADFKSNISDFHIGVGYGIISYITISYVAILLYKYLQLKMFVIIRLLACKFIGFLIVLTLIMSTKINIDNLFCTKYSNYTLESRISEYYDSEGDERHSTDNKIMYPNDKPVYQDNSDITYNDDQNNTNYCITKGYGVISGFKEYNMEISIVEKLTISGFEYFFENIINNWFSLLLTLLLFYIEFTYPFLERIGLLRDNKYDF